MANRAILCGAFLAMGALGAAKSPQEVGPLQKALGDVEPEGPWVYNDIPAGFEAAGKSGKPLLIVFRCVP